MVVYTERQKIYLEKLKLPIKEKYKICRTALQRESKRKREFWENQIIHRDLVVVEASLHYTLDSKTFCSALCYHRVV